MRRVFHGGVTVIERPLVHVGRENLDFGRGFYVTDFRQQARTWADIKSRYELDAQRVINEYALDFDSAIKEYHYKHFEHYDREWLHFIVDS